MSPKILKLIVEKGHTIQVGKDEWRKVTYGLEADVTDITTEEGLVKARESLEAKIDDWLKIEAQPTFDVPDIDLAVLDSCPWLTYKTKQPASPGKPAWTKNPLEFTTWTDVSKDCVNVLTELAKALNRLPDKKLILGTMEYSFSGKDRDTGKPKPLFISRKPVKNVGKT